MADFTQQELYEWCRIPVNELENHPNRKAPFAVAEDSQSMGESMARELVEEIKRNNANHRSTRAIIPCGPSSWYAPLTRIVNSEQVSLQLLEVFHMDECLDWQGRPLPKNHPLNFRTFMEQYFYGGVESHLQVPEDRRHWLYPNNMESIRELIGSAPIDLTLGGWGQDGHLAYNQARRNPFSPLTIEDVRESSIRVQENNVDTIMALGQRNFGSAWQFVPPMSVTLGVKECLSAKRVRVYSDTGGWKQTALRVALFGPLTPEYPMTLLQEHSDALITATRETATHPISEHPEWELF